MKKLAEFMGGLLALFIIVILLLALITGGNFFDLATFKYFAPRMEAAHRDTFEQSKAYRQGTVQDLEHMQFEYQKASPEQQGALASIILHVASDFPEEAMPTDLRHFIQELRFKRAQGEKSDFK